MRRKNDPAIIVCPKCGAEYLPCEIFLPNAFLGKACDIVKDDSGEILSFDGYNMDNRETYVCDFCKTKFEVNAKVAFTSNDVDAFNEEYATPRYVQLSLFEEDNE